MEIVILLVVGAVIGLLGKLVAPGDKDNIPFWLTVLCGVGGVLLGLVIYREALLNNDLPFASALSVIMVVANALMLTGMSFVFGKLILKRLETSR